MPLPPIMEERLTEALDLCCTHPENVQYLYDLTQLLCEAEQFDVANSTLNTFLPIHKQHAGIHEWLGRVAFLEQEYVKAIPHFQNALQRDPARPIALRLLGLCCFDRGDFLAATKHFRGFLAIQPDDQQVENSLGVSLAHVGQAQEAIEVLQQCVEKYPQALDPLTNLGDALSITGRSQEAAKWYRQAIKINPSHGQAHSGLMSSIKYSNIDHPDLVLAQEVVDKGGLSEHDEAGLRFALGKAYNDCKGFDLAFAQYKKGNDIRKKMGRAFDKTVYATYFARIKNAFSPEFLKNFSIVGSQSERPVFIVGMYRSGTSLVEQIIASHPKVFGAGELTWLSQSAANLSQRYNFNNIYPEAVSQLNQAMAKELAEEFEAELLRIAGSEEYKRISDKMPHNYFYLGMINILFPNARIIHCKRQPQDACLSIYFQDFTSNLSYTNDLADLGCYYSLYAEIMEYWQDNLSLKFHEVNYEELVSNPKKESKNLIEFLDLPWDEKCLKPHKEKRTVNTASHWQVRQQIHTKSKQRWKNYERYLQPLIESLGAYKKY
ncbi:MAG: sulfotransferase [Magnetococcales bacterium]|nr:sulfotransferase [Magnetococcales bacterium]